MIYANLSCFAFKPTLLHSLFSSYQQALPVLHSSLPFCILAFPHHICKPFLFCIQPDTYCIAFPHHICKPCLFCIQADNISKPFLIIFASLTCFAFKPTFVGLSLKVPSLSSLAVKACLIAIKAVHKYSSLFIF
jgi:hypothetical protein